MVPRMHFKVALALAGALALGTPLHAQDCSGASWTPIDSLNTARSRTGVAYDAVTGHFFAAGGEASGGNRNIPIEEYDPVGNRQLGNVPQAFTHLALVNAALALEVGSAASSRRA